MTRARHDRELQLLVDRAEELIREEYRRDSRACAANVHAWAVEATSNLFTEGNPVLLRSKALAAFQQADALFKPAPLTASELAARAKTQPKTLSEVLYAWSPVRS